MRTTLVGTDPLGSTCENGALPAGQTVPAATSCKVGDAVRIAVLVADAMESSVAACFVLARADVMLLGRSSRHLAEIQRAALLLVEENGRRRVVPVPVTDEPATVASVDLVVLLVKARATHRAASVIRQRSGPSLETSGGGAPDHYQA